MARRRGIRNFDYTRKRQALLKRCALFALSQATLRPSLRQFANAVGVSEPTLRHYFGSREGLVIAILTRVGGVTARAWRLPPSSRQTARPDRTLPALFEAGEGAVAQHGFLLAHVLGMTEAVANARIADAYIDTVIEPSLTVIERELVRSGVGRATTESARAASLSILATTLFVACHHMMSRRVPCRSGDLRPVLSYLEHWMVRGLTR